MDTLERISEQEKVAITADYYTGKVKSHEDAHVSYDAFRNLLSEYQHDTMFKEKVKQEIRKRNAKEDGSTRSGGASLEEHLIRKKKE